jgi:hypothetical protein
VQGLVTGLSLLIVGGVVLLTTMEVRESIRGQIAGRDGAVLHAVTLMQQYEDTDGAVLLGPMEDHRTQQEVILKTSR